MIVVIVLMLVGFSVPAFAQMDVNKSLESHDGDFTGMHADLKILINETHDGHGSILTNLNETAATGSKEREQILMDLEDDNVFIIPSYVIGSAGMVFGAIAFYAFNVARRKRKKIIKRLDEMGEIGEPIRYISTKTRNMVKSKEPVYNETDINKFKAQADNYSNKLKKIADAGPLPRVAKETVEEIYTKITNTDSQTWLKVSTHGEIIKLCEKLKNEIDDFKIPKA